MPEKMIKNIIVKAPANDVFALWKDFEQFPKFMKNIKSVRRVEGHTSHWTMREHMGKCLEWTAKMTDVIENKRIAWSSISRDLKTSGQVTFNQLNDNETDVTVHMQYVPPAGALGKMAAHLFENPQKDLEEDLRRFKEYAEGRVISK
ncbi:MAG: SRPBCC family protein [Candidatus Omnitrophica bacterium]|nr:SRPBCC family protein [Candidatus Omnitrophota bacterium]